jgi:predicted DNA-binding protein
MAMEVSKVARGYLNHRWEQEDAQRTITFSIRLPEGQHAKLKFLAGRFDVPKGVVAQKLLNAAMEEAMRTLAAHDALSHEAEEQLPSDEQNRIIDRQLEDYSEEIQRIFDNEVGSR